MFFEIEPLILIIVVHKAWHYKRLRDPSFADVRKPISAKALFTKLRSLWDCNNWVD